MKLRCNLCPMGSRKTDNLKLRTINGRDYLLCRMCWKWSNSNGQQNGEGNISRVSETTSGQDGTIQPSSDSLSSERVSVSCETNMAFGGAC